MAKAERKTTSKTSSLLDVPRAPPGQRATPEQHAEMLRELRKLLGLDTEEVQRAVRELSQQFSQLQKSELSQQLDQLQKAAAQWQKSEVLQQLRQLQKSFKRAPRECWEFRPTRLALRLPQALGREAHQPANPPAVPDRLKSAKEWVPEVVKPVRDKLLAIGTTKASRWVASQEPPDGKPVKDRSVEKILRDNLGFPKADRGSKRRPK